MPDSSPHSIAKKIVRGVVLPDYPELAELARDYLSLEEQLEAAQAELARLLAMPAVRVLASSPASAPGVECDLDYTSEASGVGNESARGPKDSSPASRPEPCEPGQHVWKLTMGGDEHACVKCGAFSEDARSPASEPEAS